MGRLLLFQMSYCSVEDKGEEETETKLRALLVFPNYSSLQSQGKKSMGELTPFAAMVVLELFFVGLSILTKAALMKGMSSYIFVFYSNAFATLLISPFAYFFDRHTRPALTITLLCKFFFMSLIGITLAQNLVSVGVDYSSPTLSSALTNLIPAFTFLLAVIFRMEKVNWRSSTTQIKIMGTVLSISGALVVVLCNGKSTSSINASASGESNRIVGGLFFTFAALCMSLWIVLQKPVIEGYPAQLSLAAFYLLFASIQCGVVCLVTERNNPNAWTLMPDINIKLIAVIYAAVVGCIGFCYVKVWCVNQKGPVYVSMFKPLGVAIAAFMSFIFFGEKLHLGMVVGAVIIVIGFYGVLWAKSKENKQIDSHKLPLLQNDKLSHGKQNTK